MPIDNIPFYVFVVMFNSIISKRTNNMIQEKINFYLVILFIKKLPHRHIKLYP